MAGSKNAVSLIGRLGADPEKKTFSNGGSLVNLRVATSETWKDKDSGERREITEWHQVVIKNENLGKIADQYLKKGDRVGIEGKIQTRKWKDNNDVERYSTEVVVGPFGGELILLESKNGGSNDNDRGGRDDDRGSSRGGGGGRGNDDRGGDRGGRGSSRSDSRGDDRGGDQDGRGRSDDRGSRDSGGSSNSSRGNSRSQSNDRSDMDDDIPF